MICRQEFSRSLFQDPRRFARHLVAQLIQCLSWLFGAELFAAQAPSPALRVPVSPTALPPLPRRAVLAQIRVRVILTNGLEQKTRTAIDLAGGLLSFEQVDFFTDVMQEGFFHILPGSIGRTCSWT